MKGKSLEENLVLNNLAANGIYKQKGTNRFKTKTSKIK